MGTLSREFAEAFARDWVAAWNAKDLDRVLSHYTDGFEFRSPMIAVIVGEPSGRLVGKEAVASYWREALSRIGALNFEVQDLLIGADCLTLYYRGHRGLVAETFFFDPQGRVHLSVACYAAPAA